MRHHRPVITFTVPWLLRDCISINDTNAQRDQCELMLEWNWKANRLYNKHIHDKPICKLYRMNLILKRVLWFKVRSRLNSKQKHANPKMLCLVIKCVHQLLQLPIECVGTQTGFYTSWMVYVFMSFLISFQSVLYVFDSIQVYLWKKFRIYDERSKIKCNRWIYHHKMKWGQWDVCNS